MNSIIITGGHHSSALPVINELRMRFPDIKIYWFGHKYSMAKDENTTLEYREITSMGIKFYDLKAGKFYKTFNPARLIKIPLGFIQSFYWLIRIKPDVIMSFGGYLAVPVVITGKLLKIPSLTHEQTSVVGYANKLISHFVDLILLTWPETVKYFDETKTQITGLPLRNEIFSVNSNSFLVENDLKTIYITAGKTGSHKINDTIYQFLKEILSNFNIIHQTGDHSLYKDFDKLEQKYEKIKGLVKGRYYLRKFVLANEIGEAFAKSDFVISRSGAHICYELVALKKPCILIPIPWVSHNEQYKNASLLKKAGLAKIIEEKNITGEKLMETLNEFSSEILSYKITETKEYIIKNSAQKITDAICQVYTNKKN